MLDRMGMIGEIRDMLPLLWEQGRFEVAREIMDDVDHHNFTGVSDAEVRRIHTSLQNASWTTPEGE